MAGHSIGMRPARALEAPPTGMDAPASASARDRDAKLDVGQLYEQYIDYVFRVARRLGVAQASVDDVVQDVFLTVHRRLPDFEGRSTIATWLYGITIRVVRDHRRRQRRKPSEPLLHDPATQCESEPEQHALQAEQIALLHGLLDTLSDPKREVFVLAELEQMSSPAIAEVLGLNLNTVYARLRAARQDFELALTRHRAREGREHG